VSRSAERLAPRATRGGALPRLATDERGATAVEFAFVFGPIILLLLGILQVGLALMERNQISHALSQTVRQVHLDPTMGRTDIEAAMRDLLTADAKLDVCVEPIEGTSVARIVVDAPFEFRIPFVPIGTVMLRLETIAPRITRDAADTNDSCT
jgi:Flp pilus assembly protein TadG